MRNHVTSLAWILWGGSLSAICLRALSIFMLSMTRVARIAIYPKNSYSPLPIHRWLFNQSTCLLFYTLLEKNQHRGRVHQLLHKSGINKKLAVPREKG